MLIFSYIIVVVTIIVAVIGRFFLRCVVYTGGRSGKNARVSDADHTYCIANFCIKSEYARGELNKLAGWVEVERDQRHGKNIPARVDFFHYDGSPSPEGLGGPECRLRYGTPNVNTYYPMRATLRYWINVVEIWDKAKLHAHLTTLAPDTICKTIIYDKLGQLPPGVWMIRSNLGHVGTKSRAVDNQQDFETAYREFTARTAPIGPRSRIDVIMASEYIVDPMLYNERKFHLRCYIIIAVYGHGPSTTRRAWMINVGYVIPAGRPYVSGEWADPTIHDSHGTNNPNKVLFPDEFDRPELIAKCVDLLRRVLGVLLPFAINFPEAEQVGYEIYGSDIMFTAAGEPKLIEINSYPAYTLIASRYIFDALLGTVFSDVFGPAGDPTIATLLT